MDGFGGWGALNYFWLVLAALGAAAFFSVGVPCGLVELMVWVPCGLACLLVWAFAQRQSDLARFPIAVPELVQRQYPFY